MGAGAAPGEPHSREVRIRKGGRGAGQLYMHLEETEEKAVKQARARIISAAHRSTLPPPLVLAKPVTAGPTPCGPSFTPAPHPQPPLFPLHPGYPYSPPPPLSLSLLLLPPPTVDPPRLKPNLPPTPPPASPLPHHRTILKKSPMGQRKKVLASLLFGA